mgnify:CR=1 FL=1
MKSVGIICEYNPFHNGHLYHINKVKEMFPDYTIILIQSSSFTERGEVSIINKFDKTKIALNYGVDLVVELPFVFSTQSADIFAKGSLSLLNHLNCEYLVFGSESNDINSLKELAKIQLKNKKYDKLVKKYMDDGINYPTAMNKALNDLGGKSISNPNDLLGLSYIKEIIKNNYNITPVSIERTNDYHSLKTNNKIISASAIRSLIKNKKRFKKYVPSLSYKYINKNNLDTKMFELLKYKINSDNNLSLYQTVDEGIENRITKHINSTTSLDELISKIKTKRYTYNKISRMLIHILCNFTKEEANKFKEITYIRILGFNDKGKNYLNTIKKNSIIPIITNPKNSNDEMLNLEHRVTNIYNVVTNNNIKDQLEKPIIN